MSTTQVPISVYLADTLSSYSGSERRLQLNARNVGEALQRIALEHPRLHTAICDDRGAVRRHIHLFINSEFVAARSDSGLMQTFCPGDVLSILTAVSGG